MIELDADVAVLGAGFGGSVMALVLQRIGLRPALIERGTHPRFAIGESSTPIANLVLRDIAQRYDLPRLAPLAKYGPWQATYPHVVSGLKRGFCYFQHEVDRPFVPRPDHVNELLVAASSDDEHGDTHWLRADVDHFLMEEARSAGVPYLDRTEISGVERTNNGRSWQLTGQRGDEPVRITARFLIDASGDGGLLARAFGISRDPVGMHTHSRAIFSHFTNLKPWHDFLAQHGGRVNDHPFCCDHAALHHLIDGGWMYQLRFNNGVTSAGFSLDPRRYPLDETISVAEEWDRLLTRYPSIAAQFAETEFVSPPGPVKRTGRLQRRAEHVIGDGWAMLPHTAGFVDPLHSSGIAQTFCGIERLARILEQHIGKPGFSQKSGFCAALQHYECTVHAELDLIDRIVACGFATMGRFKLFTPSSMLYFVAATTYERRRCAGEHRTPPAFLCADDPQFVSIVNKVQSRLGELLNVNADAAEEIFVSEVANAIAPYNHVSLLDPNAHNMYYHTAVKDD